MNKIIKEIHITEKKYNHVTSRSFESILLKYVFQ
jgi:hypothetical protein